MRNIKILLLIGLFYSPWTVGQIDDDQVDDLIGLYDNEELISIATGTEKQLYGI